MKRRALIIVTLGLVAVGLIVAPTQAATISVAGPASSLGTPPAIIAAPSDVLDDCVTNTGMQAFDEAQDVTTTVAHSIDGGGVIPAGTVVDSHMIFLNSATGSLSHRNVVWTFDQPIIGVMSDQPGALEAASTFELGAPGTNYTVVPTAPATTPCGTNDATVPPERAGPYNARGMESADSYTVAGNSITVGMGVSEPGDWIRVVTRGTLDVEIDIKPGSDPNAIEENNRGVIPVAILTTDDFDATSVDADTVRFGPAGAEKMHPNAHIEDVDGDGDLDMVLHFWTRETGLSAGDTEATLTGQTLGGMSIEGSDSVLIVPPQ